MKRRKRESWHRGVGETNLTGSSALTNRCAHRQTTPEAHWQTQHERHHVKRAQARVTTLRGEEGISKRRGWDLWTVGRPCRGRVKRFRRLPATVQHVCDGLRIQFRAGSEFR